MTYFQSLAAVAQSIGQGDLSNAVDVASPQDVLGQAIKVMQEQLRGLLQDTQAVALTVHQQTTELRETHTIPPDRTQRIVAWRNELGSCSSSMPH
jgi:methyl-accepting chemotaxis protein